MPLSSIVGSRVTWRGNKRGGLAWGWCVVTYLCYYCITVISLIILFFAYEKRLNQRIAFSVLQGLYLYILVEYYSMLALYNMNLNSQTSQTSLTLFKGWLLVLPGKIQVFRESLGVHLHQDEQFLIVLLLLTWPRNRSGSVRMNDVIFLLLPPPAVRRDHWGESSEDTQHQPSHKSFVGTTQTLYW